MFSPMPTCTARIGPSIAPASAQSAAAERETTVKSGGCSRPMAIAISRFEGAGAHQHAHFCFRNQEIQSKATAAPRR